jgi:DNA repair protein RAD5
MSKLEKGMDANEATKTLHPCWSAYNIADRYALIQYSLYNSAEMMNGL